MNWTSIVAAVLAAVFLVLYLRRRKARLRADDDE
jgi:LPXTG-motif cell wall-anchored protein